MILQFTAKEYICKWKNIPEIAVSSFTINLMKNWKKYKKNTLRGIISSTMLYLIEILYIKMHKLITTEKN